jgi:hypothetical protein
MQLSTFKSMNLRFKYESQLPALTTPRLRDFCNEMIGKGDPIFQSKEMDFYTANQVSSGRVPKCANLYTSRALAEYTHTVLIFAFLG